MTSCYLRSMMQQASLDGVNLNLVQVGPCKALFGCSLALSCKPGTVSGPSHSLFACLHSSPECWMLSARVLHRLVFGSVHASIFAVLVRLEPGVCPECTNAHGLSLDGSNLGGNSLQFWRRAHKVVNKRSTPHSIFNG